MAKIDRLGWAAGVSFVSHGARMGIRVNDPSVLPQLANHLPPGSKLARSPEVDQLYSLIVGGSEPRAWLRRYNLLYTGSARLARTMELDDLFDVLESDLHFQVALRARRGLFVQAGVVGWKGRAIVLPGRSMSGKTNLVAALVRAGATYYSDEYAVFDVRGRVHPYAKPLSVRNADGGRRKHCAASAFGGRSGVRPLPVGLIVVTHYQSGAHWRARPLSPGQAALALLDNTVLARVRPDFALSTIRRVVPGVRTLKGARGEADDFAAVVLREFDRSVD